MFKRFLTVLLITLILGLTVAQISRANYPAVMLNRNDRSSARSVMFTFNMESGSSNPVTLFFGNTFVVKFPSGSLETLLPGLTCSVSNGGVSVGPFTTTRDGDMVSCDFDGLHAGVRLNSAVVITLTNINFTSNYHGWVSLGLYTSVNNGVLLMKDNAFMSFGVNTRFWESTNAFVSVTNVSAVNTTANECTLSNGVCTELYPWSAYTLSFTVSVNKYFDEREVDLCFEINGASASSDAKYSVTSQANGEGLLNRALSSSNTDGSFGLVNNGGRWCVTGINRFINPTDEGNKILQFYRGTGTSTRTFRLTFSGFNTLTLTNNASAFSGVNTFLLWRNSNTVLSYHTFTSTSPILVKSYAFLTATTTTNTAVNNSVQNDEESSALPHSIFEHGYYHLRFSIRIPKVNSASALTIRHASSVYATESQVSINFIASTCDFSAGSAQNNVIGQRLVCSPADSSSLQSSNSSSSQISVQLPESSTSTRDIFLTVWAYARDCPKNTSGSQLLQFEYTYGTWVSSKFTSQVRCIQNVDHTSSDFSSLDRRNLQTTAASALLYQEQYNWNPFQFSYTRFPTDSKYSNTINQTSGLEQRTYENFTNSYYSGNTANGLSVLAAVLDNGQNLPLPYRAGTTDLLQGSFVVRPSRFHSFASTAPTQCVFSWFVQGTENFREVTHFNQNHDSNVNKITVNSQSIRSTDTVNAESKSDFLNIYKSELTANSITNIGFASDCFSLRAYSESIRNIFTSMSVNVSYEATVDTAVIEVRRIRFFKMLNGSMGFRENADSLSLSSEGQYFEFHGVSHNSYTKSNICLLEIKNGFFTDKLDTTHNTLMLGLLDNEILNVGNNTGDFYPISNANSDSISAYPLYSEIMSSPNSNRRNALFSPYVVLNGFSNKVVSKSTNSLFVALPCGNKTQRFTVQLFNLGSDVNKTTNFYSNTISANMFNNGVESRSLALRNKKPSENVNHIFANSVNVPLFRSLFVLTTLDLSSETSPAFFTLSAPLTLHKTLKLGGATFTRGYFFTSGSDVAISMDSTITYFNRSDSTKNLTIHGLGKVVTTNGLGSTTTNHYHFTNSAVTLEVNDPVDNNTTNSLVLEVTQNGDAYKSDNALNATIVAKIFSSNNVTGTLTLNSNSFIGSHTLCVRTGEPSTTCNVTNNSLSCSGIVVAANATTNYSISCFNLRVNADAKLTFGNDSNFDYGHESKTLSYEGAVVDFTMVSPKELTTLKPTVARVCAYSSRLSGQVNALGVVDIVVELGRTFRLGQTLTLTANLESLFVETTRTPLCSFMLQNNFQCGRMGFYDNLDNSQFMSVCTISGSGASQQIFIDTEHYVTKTGFEYPSQFVIRLSPVILKNLSAVPYTLSTNILGNSNTISSFNTEVMNLPAFAPALTTVVAPELQANAGLCNVKSISPNLASSNGQLVFNFNLATITERLAVVNEGQTSARSANEFMIYLNPEIYAFSSNLWCLLGAEQVPCEMTRDNFVYIRIGRALLNGEYEVTLQNLRVPSIDTSVNSPMNNQTFLCSVNFYDAATNMRESLRNGFGNSMNTFNIKATGNFLYYTSHDGLLSSMAPRGSSNYTLRFIYDFTDGFNSVKFTAAEERTPVLYVLFPRELMIRSTLVGVTATLEAYVQNFVVNENVTTTTIIKSTTDFPLTVTPIFGGLRLAFNTREVSFPDNLEYFELKINGIPTPESSGTLVLPSLVMLNDDTNPTMMMRTHANLRNRTGPFEGLAFSFNTTGRGLVEASVSTSNFLPGRYYMVNFSLSGSRIFFNTKVSLASGSVFRTPDNMGSTSLNTGVGRSSSLWVGTSCDTLYGAYWLNFTNDGTNTFRMSPMRINLQERHASNREVITFSRTMGSSSDESTFAIPNGGFLPVYVMTSLPPVENVSLTFSVPTAQNNNAAFGLQSPADSQNILAGRTMSYFTYQLTALVEGAQRINVNISNKCYALGSSRTDLRTLTFNPTANLVANLDTLNVSAQFKYVVNLTTEPVNQLKFRYEPRENTHTVLALLCSTSDVPTRDQAVNAQGNSLARYRTIVHSTNAAIDVVFDNLERKAAYKLVAWVSNFGVVNRTTVNATFESMALNTNATDMRKLETPDVSQPEHLRFRFMQNQTDLSLNRLQEFLQTRFSINDGLVVRNHNRNTLPGFAHSPIRSCAKTSATAEFQPATNTTLRFLQTNSTNSTTNSTNSTTPAPVTPTFAQTLFYTVSQNGASRVSLNTTALVEAFYRDVDTEVKRNALLGNLGLEGTWDSAREIDVPFNAALFLFNNSTYSNATGVLSFNAVADRMVTCDWKLFNDQSNNGTVLSADVIRQCTTTTDAKTVSCGKVTFNVASSVKTTSVTVGVLGTGNHYVHVVCSSPIPNSSNQVVFRNSQGIVVSPPVEEPTETATEEPVGVNFISLNSLLVFLLAFLLVDL